MTISVQWTGTYPALCYGEWIISIDGKSLENLGNDHFATYNEYRSVYMNGDYDTVEDYYDAGFVLQEWLDYVKTMNRNNLLSSIQEAIKSRFSKQN